MMVTLTATLKDWLAVRPVESEHVFVNLGQEQFTRKHYGQQLVK